MEVLMSKCTECGELRLYTTVERPRPEYGAEARCLACAGALVDVGRTTVQEILAALGSVNA